MSITRWAHDLLQTIISYEPSLFIALCAVIAINVIAAWVIGSLSIRVSGVYFEIITFDFIELFHQAVFKFEWTGGSDGLLERILPTRNSVSPN